MMLECNENNYFVCNANILGIVKVPSKMPCLFSDLALFIGCDINTPM
jgi:hypothetical protein